jgi:hypothetical protein
MRPRIFSITAFAFSCLAHAMNQLEVLGRLCARWRLYRFGQ